MVLRSGEIGSLKARIALALPSFQTSRTRDSDVMCRVVGIILGPKSIDGAQQFQDRPPARRRFPHSAQGRAKDWSPVWLELPLPLPAPPAFGAALVGNDPMMPTCVTVVPSISQIATWPSSF